MLTCLTEQLRGALSGTRPLATRIREWHSVRPRDAHVQVQGPPRWMHGTCGNVPICAWICRRDGVEEGRHGNHGTRSQRNQELIDGRATAMAVALEAAALICGSTYWLALSSLSRRYNIALGHLEFHLLHIFEYYSKQRAQSICN